MIRALSPGHLLYALLPLLASCTTTGDCYRHLAEGDSFLPDSAIPYEAPVDNDGILRIVTLNIAHGRNQAANQLLLGKQDIEKNLKTIAQVLRESGADVIALQEADGPSRWSGNFDHIGYQTGCDGNTRFIFLIGAGIA